MASETQRERFRRYFNDTGETVFTDDEIDAIFEEVAEFVTDNDRLTMVEARLAGLDMLLMDASKRVSYKQNASSENQSDIFKALKEMRGTLEKERGRLESLGSAVRLANTKRVPARKKDVPS